MGRMLRMGNGFVLEGTRRASLLHRGVRKDVRVGSLLPTEFVNHGQQAAQGTPGGARPVVA
jgi:hypothetical protein